MSFWWHALSRDVPAVLRSAVTVNDLYEARVGAAIKLDAQTRHYGPENTRQFFTFCGDFVRYSGIIGELPVAMVKRFVEESLKADEIAPAAIELPPDTPEVILRAAWETLHDKRISNHGRCPIVRPQLKPTCDAAGREAGHVLLFERLCVGDDGTISSTPIRSQQEGKP